MSDIVERLLDEAKNEPEWTSVHLICTQAASEITRLQECIIEVERLQAELASVRNDALEEAAKVADEAGRAALQSYVIAGPARIVRQMLDAIGELKVKP